MIQLILLFLAGVVVGGIIVQIYTGDIIYKMFLRQRLLLDEIDILHNQMDAIKNPERRPSVN